MSTLVASRHPTSKPRNSPCRPTFTPVDLRDSRGNMFQILVGPEWVLEDFSLAYHRMISVKKYGHHFVCLPRKMLKPDIPILDQISKGETVEAVNYRDQLYQRPIEILVAFKESELNVDLIRIYADRSWTIFRLKEEISLQKGDDVDKESEWRLPTVWKKFELKRNGYTLENEHTLDDYCLQDDCEIDCEPLVSMLERIWFSFKSLMMPAATTEQNLVKLKRIKS